jgi:hypothetical protein
MPNFDDDEAAAKAALGAGCVMFTLYIIGIITVIAVIIAAAIKFL